jgi:signal transduction histidine kinase/ActR/RegA family two-component response regulator
MYRSLTEFDSASLIAVFGGALIALLALWDYVATRRAPWQAAAMFAGIASGMFFAELPTDTSSQATKWVFVLGAVLLFTEPYLLVQLLNRFRPVPRSVSRGIFLGMLASWAITAYVSPLPKSPPVSTGVAIFVIGAYVVAVEVYAVVGFIRGALESPGVNRRRLILAAAGSALFALAVSVEAIRLRNSGADNPTPIWEIVLSVIMGAAGLSYYLGFAPPGWLRQAWQNSELRRFLRERTDLAAGARAAETLDRLVVAANRATGATNCVAALWDESRELLVARASDGGVPEIPISAVTGELKRAMKEKKSVAMSISADLDRAVSSLADHEATALFAVPIVSQERLWGLLLVFLRSVSLFPEDDLTVLGLLAEQSAIALANAELISELRTLAERLQHTNAELEHASQAKSDFLASMSHELRTPLNAILGFTDALLGGVDGPLNDEQRVSLGWVQRGGRDLLALINDVLDLSRIEAGKLVINPQPFSPRELVEGVCGQNRRVAEEKGIKLTWEDQGAPAELILDRQRTQQILVNLVGNAVKFTDSGEVAVTLSPVGRDRVKIAVRDTGPGIRPEDRELLFQEFRQVGAGSQKAGGSGLGLAISRRLARMMGGDISLRSKAGKGSTFTVTLPVDYQQQTHRPERRQRGATVLLAIDDDRSLPPLLEKMLAGTNYQVVGAHDSLDALRIARELHPDVITLDILMPERDGWKILEDLRLDPVTHEIPVVILTIVDQSQSLDHAGAAGYLSKPLNKEAVVKKLDEVLGMPARATG